MEAVSQPDSFEAYKRMAGEQAVELIQSGMAVGLGTGSTAIWAIFVLTCCLAKRSNEFHHFAMISNVY
ncbi:MAG TPA: hypothetical protein PKE45_20990 [Caldilineaceae bacterium]|nr:hypothetical protein [Caldilineaceae bacterium]